ncbi:MAG: glycosyltransferase family 4 protein, partial [Patescibacteria group bacterium]
IDYFWLQAPPSPMVGGAGGGGAGAYFFLASTLVPYKRIELAIGAARILNVPLKIAGEGPDRGRLESLAGPTVEFLGYRREEDLRGLYA